MTWKCPKCEADNDERKVKCEVCDTKKPPIPSRLKSAAKIFAEMECIDFIEKAIGILQEKRSLATRYGDEIEYLKNRKNAWSADRIRLGVLGVTSSGKSTLINAIIGRELLSSAGKPTSSQLVSCTRGTPARAVICFNDKDDKILKDENLTKDAIKKYGDERFNHDNREGVKYIYISTPEFDLGDTIEIVDSAGLDAYKLESHEKLSLEILLPTIDMCVFVTTLKPNSDEKTKTVLNAVAKHNRPLVIVQNMLDSVEPKADGSKTKEKVAEEYKTRLERIIEHSDITDKGSVHIVQMSALFAQDERCHGKKEKGGQNSYYREFKILTENMAKAFLPKINAGRCASLYTHYAEFVSSEEAKISGKITGKAVFKFEGVKDNVHAKAEKTAGLLEAEIKELSGGSANGTLNSIKKNVKNCEENILEYVSDFNKYLSKTAEKLNISPRDIVIEAQIDSIPEPGEIYKTETHREKVEKPGFFAGIARFFGTIFDADWGYEYEVSSEQVLDKTRMAEELNRYIKKAKRDYGNSIKSWLNGIEKAIDKIDKEIDDSYKSFKKLQAEIKSIEDVEWVLSGLKSALKEIKKIVPKKTDTEPRVDFSQNMERPAQTETAFSGYQIGIRNLAGIVIGKVFAGIIQTAQSAAEAPEHIVITGWENKSLQDFLFRFFAVDSDTIETELEKTKTVNHKGIAIRLNPDERFFRITQGEKQSHSFYIMVNAHQDGSAKKRISELKLSAALKPQDKVFFVVQDFHSIINSGTAGEMNINMQDYYKEFVPKKNKGLLLINDDNPVYSLAYLENQIRPCDSLSDETKLLRTLQDNFKHLFHNNGSMISNTIGDLIRVKQKDG